MQEIELTLDRIIAPHEMDGEELIRPEILALHHYYISRGAAPLFPLFASPSHSDRGFLMNRTGLSYMPALEEFFESMDSRPQAFYLIDGNHRTLSLALARRPIKGWLLENDDDVRHVADLNERGLYPNMGALATEYYDHGMIDSALVSMVTSLEEQLCMQPVMSMQERLDYLIREEMLPAYMVKDYRGWR